MLMFLLINDGFIFLTWMKCKWEIFELRDLNLNVDKISFEFERE
jgi:hypothetical protein